MIKLEPIAPLGIGGQPFRSLSLAVPHYAGQGTYDLASYEARDDWDGTLIQLTLGSEDESLYWTTESGPGVITVSADARTIEARLAMEDAGSRHVDVYCTITLA